jgi:predicted metal-binding membrane protein
MLLLDRRNAWLPVIGGLIAFAWITLAVWAQSPYGRYLDHGAWLQNGIAANLCRALPGGSWLLPALLYVGGWLLMTVAMMLPTTLPLLALFARLTERRDDRPWLITCVVLGYLAVWTAFGVAAHGADLALHALAGRSVFLTFNGWAIGAGLLALAGVFQFSDLKYRCLDKCRTPFSFINQHWRGSAVRRQSFLLGVRHGAFCVGCCWAIMLLMFVVGTGSVGWMLLIGAVMAVEKNAPWGRRLSAPLGIVLLLSSGATIAFNVLGGLALGQP